MASNGAGKTRVLILGSGPGGLAAAAELSETQELRDRYDVTVLELGWKPGGKCTSFRFGEEQRIVLNGTHYVFGCYDHVFKLFRKAFAELNASGDFKSGTFEEQLLPRNRLVFKQFFKGNWTTWNVEIPTNGEQPGSETGLLSPLDYLEELLEGMVELFLGWQALAGVEELIEETKALPRLNRFLHSVEAEVVRLLGGAVERSGVDRLRTALESLKAVAAGAEERLDLSGLRLALREFRHWLWHLVERVIESNVELLRLWIMLDLGVTAIIGMIEDDVFGPEGFDVIDGYDFRAWLTKHGASKQAVWSAPIATWYDAVAAYEFGDTNSPNLSAAVSLKAMSLAMLCYKGSFAYQLRSEVGESFVAPVVQALRNRGVKFRFFHRVWEVIPQNGEIVALRVERQVELVSGDPDSYEPFIEVKGQRAIPGNPLYDQIATPNVQGAELDSFYTSWRGGTMMELKKGTDFDQIVFSLPVQTIPFYCQQILAQQPKWREMVEHVRATETQSLRLYFKPTMEELGWPGPPPILSGYANPYNTWEDACELTPRECWPEGEAPNSVATIFGPLPAPKDAPPPADTSYPDRQMMAAREAALRFCSENVGSLWPGAASIRNPTGIDWEELVDLDDREGQARFNFQILRANAGPTARYTMAVAGSLQYRLRAHDSGYSNLFLAGDWVRNGLDIGCFEAAIISGQQAAQAILGNPPQGPHADGPVRRQGR